MLKGQLTTLQVEKNSTPYKNRLRHRHFSVYCQRVLRGLGLEKMPRARDSSRGRSGGNHSHWINVLTHQLGLLEGVLSYRPKSDLRLNSEMYIYK